MSLLTAAIDKESYILGRIYFIFLKHPRKENLKIFYYQIWEKIGKAVAM